MPRKKQPEVVQTKQPRNFLWRNSNRREIALAFHVLCAERAIQSRNRGNFEYARSEAEQARKFYKQWQAIVVEQAIMNK